MAGSGAARPSFAPAARGPVAPKATTRAALLERLRTVVAEMPPADALQPALQAIVEEFHAAAGAVCSFDVRHGLLRLTAEHGLSDEGCKRLRTIKAKDPNGWDIPLHGVLNRRAYLIEKASENRYVPALVDGPLPLRAVVCLPLFDGAAPLGSLILVTVGARNFGEADVRQLAEPGQMLAHLIEAMRRDPGHGASPSAAAPAPAPKRVEVGAVLAERDALRAELDARSDERARLAEQLRSSQLEIGRLRGALANAETAVASLTIEREQAQHEAARVPELASSGAAAERERTRLADALAAARAELAEREQRVAAVDAARAAAQALGDQLEAEAAGLRAELADHVARAAAELAAARADAGRDLADAQRALAEARAAVAQRDDAVAEVRAELAAGADREAGLRRQLAGLEGRTLDLSSTAAELSAARDALAGAQAEIAAARTAAEAAATTLASTQAERDALAQQLAERDATAAGLRAALDAAAAERSALADAHEALRSEQAQAHAAAVAAQREAAEAREAAVGLERALADERGRSATAVAERDQLHAALDAAQRREAQLRDEILRRETERDAADHADVRAALDSARAAEAAHESARAEAAAAVAELATLRDELQRVHAAHDAVATEAAGLRVGLDAARADAERIGAALAAAESAAHERAEADAATLRRQQAHLAEHEAALAGVQRQLAERDDALAARDRLVAEARANLETEVARRAEDARRLAALETELSALREAVTQAGADAGTARDAAAKQAAAVGAAQAETQRLTAELATVQQQASVAAATLATADAERAELAAALERARDAEVRRQARVADLEAALAAAHAETAEARRARDAERESAETARLTERTALDRRLADLERQLETQRQELAGATARVEHLTAALAGEQATTGALTAELAAARTEIDGLVEARDRAQVEAATRAEELARLLDERAASPALRAVPASGRVEAETPVEPPTDDPPGPSGGTRRPRAAEPAADGGGATVIDLPVAAAPILPLVVIDTADRWGDAVKDRKLCRFAPDAVPADALGPDDVDRIVVNLAAPGALAAMQSLRQAGVTTTFWGCLVDAAGTKALALGPVEILDVPLDADAAIEALGTAANRAGRVITAGADVDALMSIRQALSRRQASVSMAWDAKQVIDLLAVAQPNALVADLDLPRRDGYAIVAAVAACKVPPRLVLVGGGDDVTESLARITRDPALGRLLQPLEAIAGSLAARVEAVPQDRGPRLTRPIRATK